MPYDDWDQAHDYSEDSDSSSEYGHLPSEPPAFTKPPRLVLRKRDDTTTALADAGDANVKSEPVEINLDTLLPGEANPIDHPEQYNPYNYCYKVMITELNMELIVRFFIEDLDHDEKYPIHFIRDGIAYEIPFFPRPQEGTDPAETYEGPGDHYKFYRAGEHHYAVIPMVVRAKILGNGLSGDEGIEDVLINKDLVIAEVPPERLAEALEELRDEVSNDNNVPMGLYDLLTDALGYSEDWSGDSGYRTAGESLGWDD